MGFAPVQSEPSDELVGPVSEVGDGGTVPGQHVQRAHGGVVADAHGTEALLHTVDDDEEIRGAALCGDVRQFDVHLALGEVRLEDRTGGSGEFRERSRLRCLLGQGHREPDQLTDPHRPIQERVIHTELHRPRHRQRIRNRHLPLRRNLASNSPLPSLRMQILQPSLRRLLPIDEFDLDSPLVEVGQEHRTRRGHDAGRSILGMGDGSTEAQKTRDQERKCDDHCQRGSPPIHFAFHGENLGRVAKG